jgi:hypothetical protein
MCLGVSAARVNVCVNVRGEAFGSAIPAADRSRGQGSTTCSYAKPMVCFFNASAPGRIRTGCHPVPGDSLSRQANARTVDLQIPPLGGPSRTVFFHKVCLLQGAAAGVHLRARMIRSEDHWGRGLSLRSVHWLCLLGLVLLALAPGQGAEAAPGLRYPVDYGPLNPLLLQEYLYSSPSQPGQALIPVRPGKAMGDIYLPFNQKSVKVDSNRVLIETGGSFGFGFEGEGVTLPLDQFLKLGYAAEYERLWQEKVTRARRAQKVEQRRQGTKRLEWRVPRPRNRILRRIVGEDGPSLSINGERTITISGKSQWTKGEVQTLTGRPSRFPALSMDQESKFTVEGKVGELINLRITQDTQSLSTGLQDQLANLIRLDYKSDNDDAIFQEIQAGNTTLSLPGTRFVGFSQQAKGLFGVRTKGQVGPVGFTAIASHEKTKSNRRTFKGGALVDTLRLRDWQYLRNTFFFLDGVYRERLGDYQEVAKAQPSDFNPEDVVDSRSFEVYINDFNTNNDPEQQARPGVAWIDLDGPVREESGYVERGTWERLDPDDDYTLVAELGYLILNRPVQERHALAVAYRTASGQLFGATATEDSLRLKLVKPRDARPEFPTWDLEWKNVYRIASGFGAGRKFEADKIEVRILKEVPGREPDPSQSGKSYLQVLGVDKHGRDPGTPADRLIDADYVGLDEFRGLLILPDLTPFAPQHSSYKPQLEDPVPEIYTSQQNRDLVEASTYIIESISSSSDQRISLGQLGVDTESVQVRLNGEALERGIDFNVDFVGNVSFIGAKADQVADPGADLEITYESQDLLGIGSQQKTLLGLRGEYEFWDGDGTLGSTVIFNNERSNDDRVRVGNEPARTLVWDMDLNAKFEAPFLTRVVDAMPLLKTSAKSEINLRAEVAQSRPNLNTKGQGYIDDFEGSERPDLLSVIRTRWTPASLPEEFFDPDNQGRFFWFNPFDRIRRTEIWPNQEDQVEAQNNLTDVLVLELDPRDDRPTSWGGVMASFSGGVRDFSLSKFLDVWVRGEEGRLHIDLGALSEDHTGDGQLNTEDNPLPGRTTGDGLVSEKEDIGIDRRDLDAELSFYLAQAGIDTAGLGREEKQGLFAGAFPERDPEDPEGDDWFFNERFKNDNDRINGTEGNTRDGASTRPDTEDLNNDGVLNTRNDYYHYTIDLAVDEFVPGTDNNGWRLFRLPLYDRDIERVGNPDSSRVEYARLVYESAALAAGTRARVEIAQMEIIGNEWQEGDIALLEGALPLRDDERFNVGVIGTDENDEYQPPPGVKIRRNSTTRVREREQSLVLAYEKFEAGHQVQATKVLSRNANYTQYRRLRMHVHGDRSLTEYIRGDSSDIELFLRFGADSTNYYEFSTAVFPGWDQRNEVDIDLLGLSQLKARLQAIPLDELPEDGNGLPLTLIDSLVAEPGRRDGAAAVYRVRGNPSMQQVRQISLGLRNLSSTGLFDGEVYVDEMRLDEARNDPGLAAFARLNSQVADFMNLDAQVEWKGEEFRSVNASQRTSTDLSANVSATTNLHQFLPGSWNFSIPFKAQFSRSEQLPRFGPNSDVELTGAQKQELRTENRKEFFEVSLSKRSSRSFLMRWTLDQMNLRLSSTKERGFSPTRPLDRKDAQTATFSYRLSPPKKQLKVFSWLGGWTPKSFSDMGWTFMPTNLAYNASANRQEQLSLQRTDADTTFQETFTLRETYAGKVNPIPPLSGDYSLQVNRDLRKKYAPSSFSFGREVDRNQKADVSFNPRFVKWIDQSYTFQAKFEEVNDPRRRRTQAVIDTTTGATLETRDISTDNNLSVRFNLRLPVLLRAIGKSAPRSRAPLRSRTPKSAIKGPEAAGEKKAEVKEPKVDKPFFVRRLLYFTGGFIEPLNTTWRRTTRSRNFNLTGRPPLLYQLGLEENLEVERAAAGLTQQDQWDRNTTINTSSGLKLPWGFGLKGNFEDRQTRRIGSSQDRLRVEAQQTFPRLSLSWPRAARLPLIRRVVQSAQLSVSYDESENQQGEGSLARRNLISRGESRQFSATWSGRWKLGFSTKLTTTRSEDREFDFELAGGLDSLATDQVPPLRGRSQTRKVRSAFEIKYDLKPRSLPLFGQLKSSVNLDFDLAFSEEERASATGTEELAPIASTGSWKASLNATYRFSDNFRGGGLVLVEDNTNKVTDKTRKIREVRLTGTLFFR